MEINHKKIWITGASSGIGKAVEEKFAKQGWKVAVSARSEDKLLEMSKNQNIFSFPCDVTKKDQDKILFKKLLIVLEELTYVYFQRELTNPKMNKE